VINSSLLWSALLLVLLPVMAQGAEGPDTSKGFSFLSSFFQMLAALALVIGLILLTYYIVTRLMRKIPALRPGNQHIRVLEVRAMGPRKALILIEIGGEYLLLASSGEQLALIKRINMLEEIEVIEDPPEQTAFISFLKRATSRK
jgi:flagellar protein FliO/FliZ